LALVPALLLAVACGGNAGGDGAAGSHSDATGTSHDHPEAAGLEWAREHFPSREVMLRARACTEEKTSYRFPPLPANYGPDVLTSPDPELVNAARSAPKEVHVLFAKCVFELGVQDSFYPPDQQAMLRKALDPKN